MINLFITIVLLQGSFLLLLLFKKPLKGAIGIWLVGSIVSLLLYLVLDDNGFLTSNLELYPFDTTLFFTFFFLFIRSYGLKTKMHPHHLLYFIPSLLFAMIGSIEFIYDVEFELVEFGITTTFWIYSLLALKHLWEYRRLFDRFLLYVALSISLIFFGIFTIEIFELVLFDENLVIALTTAVLLYLLTYWVIFHQPQPETTPSYGSSGLSEQKAELLEKKFDSLMAQDMLFLKNKLTLNEVAAQLHVPNQYISEILNSRKKVGFSDLINQYRIEEFIKRLEKGDYDHLTLHGLAQTVGFSSKSSFITNFKKFKGITPSEYKQQMK